ncbi:MAG TPA: metal-sensitive transcriptional regulator [Desulfomicrobiaceae bacterium]|jgi:DNA-binding FrmR family transcriptional regulator|nr:metal-sensitive transcriptional regulator [Desulfomicrobiaceae bacterium]
MMSDREQEQERLKQNVLSRMKRVEGQVRGIQRMIEDGKECKDVLVQVRAVRSALRSASGQILKRYLLECHETARAGTSEEDSRESMEKLVKVVVDFLDG